MRKTWKRRSILAAGSGGKHTQFVKNCWKERRQARRSAGIAKDPGATHVRLWLLLLLRRRGSGRQFFAWRNVGHIWHAGDAALGRVVNADAVVVQQ
jgi:hypothetical protein